MMQAIYRFTGYCLTLISLCSWRTCLSAEDLPLINFEQESDGIVAGMKKIEISGYPYAFNPGLVAWNGKLLMSFRNIPNPKDSYTSYVGLVWLDERLNPSGVPQLLDLRGPCSLVPSRAEDARLLTIGEKLYMVYSDNPREVVDRGGFRVYVAEIRWNGQKFSVHNTMCCRDFLDKDDSMREKSWVPFEYNDSLLLAYSISPHRVLKPIFGSDRCHDVALSLSDFRWSLGVLRGGTPALLHGDRYLAFFHSSQRMASVHSGGKDMYHYFMGAYTFSASPPFLINAISSKPIVAKGFYSGASYKHYWKPVKVVFPGGYVYKNGYFFVAYGRDDHEVWIAALDEKKLMQSLVPVQSVGV